MREDFIKSASIYILHKSRFTNATMNLMRAQHVSGSRAVVLKIREKALQQSPQAIFIRNKSKHERKIGKVLIRLKYT